MEEAICKEGIPRWAKEALLEIKLAEIPEQQKAAALYHLQCLLRILLRESESTLKKPLKGERK